MINVGVDLHKTQMTVCYLTDDDTRVNDFKKYHGSDGNGHDTLLVQR